MVKALDEMEVYTYVRNAVNSNWNRFPSVRSSREREDVVQDIMVKLLVPKKHQEGKNFLEYYDKDKQTCGDLETIIRVVTKRYFIDLIRTQRLAYSLDMEIGSGEDKCSLYQIIPDKENPFKKVELDEMLESLPNDKIISHAILRYPIYDKGKEIGYTETSLTYQALAELAMMGLDLKTIAEHCINPLTNNPISSSRISCLFKDVKNFMTDMGARSL